MRYKSRDMTAATNPRVMPPTHTIGTKGSVRKQSPTPARARPVTPATPVSGFGETGIPSRPDSPSGSKLPNEVTPAQIKDQSFKYGGGRSAGNRSLAENIDRKRYQS